MEYVNYTGTIRTAVLLYRYLMLPRGRRPYCGTAST
jgi:hypothetical protein